MSRINAIYCDFDGTITKRDTVNTFLKTFASSDWSEYEKLWIAGKISSQENAIKQVALLRSVSPKELEDYIYSIEIDEYFLEFLDYIKSKNIKFTVLSDGFDYFIQKTFERFNLQDIPFYANHLVYENNKFGIEFPYHNKNCDINAGMCKCEKVKEKQFCYIGDGTSDKCIAQKADILFATRRLQEYCEKNLIKHYQFSSFRNIIEIMDNELTEINDD